MKGCLHAAFSVHKVSFESVASNISISSGRAFVPVALIADSIARLLCPWCFIHSLNRFPSYTGSRVRLDWTSSATNTTAATTASAIRALREGFNLTRIYGKQGRFSE